MAGGSNWYSLKLSANIVCDETIKEKVTVRGIPELLIWSEARDTRGPLSPTQYVFSVSRIVRYIHSVEISIFRDSNVYFVKFANTAAAFIFLLETLSLCICVLSMSSCLGEASNQKYQLFSSNLRIFHPPHYTHNSVKSRTLRINHSLQTGN